MAGTCTSAESYAEELARALRAVDLEAIEAFANLVFAAWRHGDRVFVFGNGGSASTASHHALDLVKTAAVDGQPPLMVFSLTDNMGMMTAVGNDVHFEDCFRFPLSCYAEPGDMAIAVSCSGNSPNVLRACEWARESGLTVVGLTGLSGGKLKDLAHLNVHVPSGNYGVIEDLHLSIGHMAAQLLKAKIESFSMAVAECAY